MIAALASDFAAIEGVTAITMRDARIEAEIFENAR